MKTSVMDDRDADSFIAGSPEHVQIGREALAVLDSNRLRRYLDHSEKSPSPACPDDDENIDMELGVAIFVCRSGSVLAIRRVFGRSYVQLLAACAWSRFFHVRCHASIANRLDWIWFYRRWLAESGEHPLRLGSFVHARACDGNTSFYREDFARRNAAGVILVDDQSFEGWCRF